MFMETLFLIDKSGNSSDVCQLNRKTNEVYLYNGKQFSAKKVPITNTCYK